MQSNAVGGALLNTRFTRTNKLRSQKFNNQLSLDTNEMGLKRKSNLEVYNVKQLAQHSKIF